MKRRCTAVVVAGMWTVRSTLPIASRALVASLANFAVGARTRYQSLYVEDLNFDPLNEFSVVPQFHLLAKGNAFIATAGGTLDPSALF